MAPGLHGGCGARCSGVSDVPCGSIVSKQLRARYVFYTWQQQNGQGRNFCYVQFEDEAASDNAIKHMDGAQVRGAACAVQLVATAAAVCTHAPRPAGGMVRARDSPTQCVAAVRPRARGVGGAVPVVCLFRSTARLSRWS